MGMEEDSPLHKAKSPTWWEGCTLYTKNLNKQEMQHLHNNQLRENSLHLSANPHVLRQETSSEGSEKGPIVRDYCTHNYIRVPEDNTRH